MKPTVSLCVTAYNEWLRGECRWIRECLQPACDSDFIDEIVVVNDGTDDFDKLTDMLSDLPKLRLTQNPSRLHVFGNKVESVYRATSDWVLMCDSDNIMDGQYYETLLKHAPWDADTHYCADQAKPIFDYRAFRGEWGVADIASVFSKHPDMFWCLVNTGNQFIHRETFLDLFGGFRGKRLDLEQPDYFNAEDRDDEKWFLAYGANDSFFILKTWLMSGKRVHVVPGLEYDHRIGDTITSNYERGPKEKTEISPIYFAELLDYAKGEQHTYSSTWLHRNTACLLRDGCDVIIVDTDMGTIFLAGKRHPNETPPPRS